MLPHAITIITPALATDAYGTADAGLDYGTAAATRTAAAFVQARDDSTEFSGQLRRAERGDWSMFTTDQDVATGERVIWDGRTLHVTGVTRHDNVTGVFGHAEVSLREVRG